MLLSHVDQEILYRIFYYDCSPLQKKAHNPITKKCIDFSKSNQAIFRIQFHQELKKKRKVALRLGELKDYGGWIIRPAKTKELLDGKIQVEDIVENDVYSNVQQNREIAILFLLRNLPE
ncbi:MAG: hypothetical protein AB1611_22470 [bacterium]